MQVQGDFRHLFRAGLRTNFLDNFEAFEVQYTQYLNQGTMDGPEIQASIISGPNRLLEIEDGEAVRYEIAVMGPKVIGVDKEYG